MAAQNPAFCIQADAHSAELFRRAVGTLIGGNTLGTPGGCIAPADLAVTAGSGNSVSVATGECWIPGSSASHMGAYYGYNDATVNLGVTPNASNPLYAIVTASVNDQAYTGNPGVTNNTWNLLLTQGTAAPSPTVPSTPANSLLIAQILVPANAASSAAYTITDKRVFVGMPNALRNNPCGRLYGAGGQAMNTGVNATITLASTSFLRGGMTASGGNSLVVPVAGLYQVEGAVTYSGSSGILSVQLQVAGATVSNAQVPLASAATTVVATDIVQCTAGQAISISAVQTSGSNGSTYAGGSPYTFLSASLVSI